jgi:hypothetical protein
MALVLPMCFKKPKLPPKSAEDIQTEEDLKAMRASQQREIALGITEQKDAQTEAAFARIMGMTGNRSLISGPKGGMGYLGNNTGRTTGRVSGGAPIAPALTPSTPSAAPIMAGTYASFSGFGGYGSVTGSSLIGGGGRRTETNVAMV